MEQTVRDTYGGGLKICYFFTIKCIGKKKLSYTSTDIEKVPRSVLKCNWLNPSITINSPHTRIYHLGLGSGLSISGLSIALILVYTI